jgi:nucleotide-binding universal stress UspA family protein
MHESINRWEGEGGALAPRRLQHRVPVYAALPNSSDGPRDARRPSAFALPAPARQAKRRSTSDALSRVSPAPAAPREPKGKPISPTIIVGFDGSDGGRDALALGAILRDATGARLLAVSAYEHGSYEASTLAERSPSARRRHAEGAAEQARGWLEDAPRSESCVIGAPSPARALHEAATREEADLVVVGSASRGTLGRVLAGSVGERLLHGAPCAVGFAPSGFARVASSGVLVPVGAAFDGSAESRAALATAADLAGSLGGKLRAISVFERPAPAHPMFTVISYREFVQGLEGEHRSRLTKAITTLGAGVAVEPIVVEGDPVAVLAEQSRALGLLVLGSRGYGPLHAVLVGAVSSELLKRAACPTIVIPRGIQRAIGSRPIDARAVHSL